MKPLNSPLHSRSLFTRVVAATLVAIGVLAASVTVMMWGIGLYEMSRYRDRVYENVIVQPGGEPAIQTYSSGGMQNITYRSLSGEPLELENEGQLSGAYLLPPREPPPLFDWPLGWGQSLSANDGAKPRGAWYLIRDAQPEGRGYFVGYDGFSRLPIGFIARSGFRRSLPPESEWFEFGRREFPSGGVAASLQRLSFNSVANFYDYYTDDDTLPSWNIFLVDGDRVLEVNLRARTVRPILELPGITSLNLLTESAEQLGAEQGRRKWRFTNRLALRCNDRIVVLDPDVGSKVEFSLPESVRSETLRVYSLRGEKLILNWTEKQGQALTGPDRLIWLLPDGAIEREATVQLAQRSVEVFDERLASIAFAMGAPAPLVWAVFMGGIAPTGMYQSHQVASFWNGISKTIEMGWPGLVVVLALGCVSAVVVWRSQRRYFRTNTWTWCTFAFLWGFAGLCAYWLEHRRAKLEACGECAANVPRDRDACARCNAPFAAPPLVGTEIFA